jgi:hypothetical protein
LLRKACSEQIGSQVQRFGGLDTKAGILLGFVAAALSQVLGKLIDASQQPGWFARWHDTAIIGYLFGGMMILGLLLLLCSAGCAVMVLLPRSMSTGSDLNQITAMGYEQDECVKHFDSPYVEEFALLEAWKNNRNLIQSKAWWLARSAIGLGAAILSFTIAAGCIIGANAFQPNGQQSMTQKLVQPSRDNPAIPKETVPDAPKTREKNSEPRDNLKSVPSKASQPKAPPPVQTRP